MVTNNTENDLPDKQEMKDETVNHAKIDETFLQKMFSCRWIIGYLCCCARFSQSAIRQLIGMATVCMTLDRDELVPETDETLSTVYNITRNVTKFIVKMEEDFSWSSEFEGTILAAYNFGFIASPILGGYVAGHFGGKRVIAFSLTVGAAVTMLTPLAARADNFLLIFMRAVAGLVMGVVDPAIQSLWAKWAPKYEKTQLTALSYSGLSIAGITTFLVSGYLCTIPIDHGWPFIFYVFGGLALLVLFPWLYFVHDSPQQHPRIQLDEIKYINHEKMTNDCKKTVHPPWSKILRSMPFWAIIVAHVTYSWVTSWVLAYLPKYMKSVLKFDVQDDGIASSMPFIGRLLSGYICGYISDALLKKHIFKTGTVRKIFQVIGCVGCATCTMVISFLGADNRIMCVILLVIGLTFQNFTSVAFRINHLDIAPRFAGVLMGVTVTAAMVSALSAPFITSAIIEENTEDEWKYIFWIVAGLNVFGALFFVIFADGEVQEWAADVKIKVIKSTSDEQVFKRPDAVVIEDELILRVIKHPSNKPETKSSHDKTSLEGLPNYSEGGIVNPNFTMKDESKPSTSFDGTKIYEDSCTKL